MNKLYQISSGEHGKCCDFFPHGSLHPDLKPIHGFCDVKEMNDVYISVPHKKCPECHNRFLMGWPFVKPNQAGDDWMCVRCHEKKHVVNRENYHKALRETIMIELRDKGLLK